MSEVDKEISNSEEQKGSEKQAEPKTARDYLNQAWGSLTVVNREKDERVPRRKKELRRFKKNIRKAEELHPEDPESIAFLHELQNFFGYWKKRKLRADYRLISFCIILLGYLAFRFYNVAIESTGLINSLEAFWNSFSQWLSIYIVFWLGSLLLYFPAHRVPVWMSDTGNFFGKTTLIELLNLLSKKPVKGSIRYGQEHGRRIGDKFEITDRGNAFFRIIGYAVLMVLTVILLPLVTLVGFFRFYIFYK